MFCNLKSFVFVCVLISVEGVFNVWILQSIEELYRCHSAYCGPGQFDCSCFADGRPYYETQCIEITDVCDGYVDCYTFEDEKNCICDDDEFQCGDCIRGVGCPNKNTIPYFSCLPKSAVSDGIFDCLNNNDEPNTAKDWLCPKCDGVIDCFHLDIHDEANCTECPDWNPSRCDCNQIGNHTCRFDAALGGGSSTCFGPFWKCNLEAPLCTDRSDQLGCPCKDDEITCNCIMKNECVKYDGCINKTTALSNGFLSCPNEARKPYGSNGIIHIHKLSNVSECDNIGFPDCDIHSCFSATVLACNNTNSCSVSKHQTCISDCSQPYCHRKPVFQCEDSSFIFLDHFCDGTVDCSDGSDEIINQPGFKCNQCVLPQSNLYDARAHCNDSSDLCFSGNKLSKNCFQCLDKRLIISSLQVCDGVNDCYDWSDECLCDDRMNNKTCTNRFNMTNTSCSENNLGDSTKTVLKIFVSSIKSNRKSWVCQTKFGTIQATPCDGRPECRDYSDECLCDNPPALCYDSCHSYFPMGDRYCDGIEDPAWEFIIDSNCSQGFDERSCLKRFKCNVTKDNVNYVSIDIENVCDGKSDCNDNSDESNCVDQINDDRLFSSDTEMIDNPILRYAFWFIGFVVLLGNACVIVGEIVFLKKKKKLDRLGFHHIIILNISCADFLMGVYLTSIGVLSAKFSGLYGSEDYAWRSSLSCSVVGSLAVISSEASCFLMVVLTAFRLISICVPIKSLAASLSYWKASLCITWLFSLAIGITPLLNVMNPYFIHSISFSSRFHETGLVKVAKFKQFMCTYEVLSNTERHDFGNDFTNIQKFLKHSIPESAPMQLFGYYGETSVCMPRFYVARGENAWEYTLSIITLNFLCFLFIAISYILIFIESSKSAANVGNNLNSERTKTMQKRIVRIIATDFCCWIPICLIAYLRLAVTLSPIVYQITAVFLLPINSALNPFLFSSLPEKLIGFSCYLKEIFPSCKHDSQETAA